MMIKRGFCAFGHASGDTQELVQSAAQRDLDSSHKMWIYG